jgi:hypothetical protein
MREEVAQLERHLHSLLSAASTGAADYRAQVVQDANHTQPGTDAKSLPRSEFDTSGIYARALADSDSLRHEKSLLQAKLDDFELLEMTVESRLHELTTETLRQPAPPAPRDATIEAIRQLSYRVVLSNECCDLMRDLMRQSNRFPIHANPSSHTNMTTTALGWSAVFQHDGNDVNFSLTKTFPTADLDELASSVWRAFHDIHVFQKIFSPSICIEVLQRISDDAFIIRWQIDCRKVGPYVRHCRNLIFRWKSSDGCYVGCRTINEVDPSVATSNATSEAFDQFYWYVPNPVHHCTRPFLSLIRIAVFSTRAKFTQDRSGRGCEVAFAGRVGVGSGTSALARFLCAEIPISIFRWENMVVGPLFNFEPSSIV